MFVGLHYINGEFAAHRPDEQRTHGIFPLANSEEIREAVDASRTGYENWNRLATERRRDILEEWLALVYSNYALLVDIISVECPQRDRTYIDLCLQDSLKQIDYGSQVVLPPTGPTAFITSWRYGFTGPLVTLFRALSDGNTVIWMPDSMSCIFTQTLVDFANQTRLGGFNGVLQLLHGNHHKAAELLRYTDGSVVLAPNVVGMALRDS